MDGIIFDIKEGAVYDGPGLRQTIFLKGCPLRCAWCHNPEGLEPKRQLMTLSNGCLHCGACVEVCTHTACTACGACVAACPRRLRRIAGERISAQALAEKINRDADYYCMTGGGVTFSGGEPLMQSDFLTEVCCLLAPGLSCAIETSGYCAPEDFQRVMARMDIIYMDLKLMDESQHKHYTGVSNQLILHNALWLKHCGKPFVIRIPLIPTVTDTDDNLRAAAEFLQDAVHLERVELLPYHATASAKYAMLSYHFSPDFPQDKPVNANTKIFDRYGIRSCVL